MAPKQSGTRSYSPLVAADLVIGAGGTLRLPLNPDWEHAIVIIEGEVTLDGTRLGTGALHYLGTNRSGLELMTSTAAARTVLVGGAPFGEAIIMWWNFVARSAEEIRSAREDWEQHRRFGDVKAYAGARLPAPPFVLRPVASR